MTSTALTFRTSASLEGDFLVVESFFLAAVVRSADVLRELNQSLYNFRRRERIGMITGDRFHNPIRERPGLDNVDKALRANLAVDGPVQCL